MSLRAAAWVLILLTVTCIGCAPIVTQGQPSLAPTGATLQPGQNIGQTFVAVDDGLTGIQIFLTPIRPGAGEVRLHLRSDPDSGDLAAVSLALQEIQAPRFYPFRIASRPDSHGQSYYLFLEMQGEGQVQVGTASGRAYLDGALYQNGVAQDAQLTFQLLYDPLLLMLGAIRQVGFWLGLLGASAALFALPGWAILILARSASKGLSWLEKLALACGVGLAVYPLVLVWTALAGLQLGPVYAWLPPIVTLGVLIWHYRHWRPKPPAVSVNAWRRSNAFLPSVAAVIVLLILFLARLWSVRTLAAPMWGDSYQHTVIAQLFSDHGGMFHSWEPYAPYDSLTVQFGFSFAVTLFSWLTGIHVVPATILLGQILNALAVFTIYPLAVRLAGGNRWAGVGAILVAGFGSPMPAYYVNWGRYAQLAGQVILPVALWLAWEALERRKDTTRQVLIGAAVLAGMLLTYYRMPFYYATMILALLVGWCLPRWGLQPRLWVRGLVILASVAAAALALLIPWVTNVSGGLLANEVGTGMSTASTLDQVLADYAVWRDISTYVPWWLAGASLLGLAFALVKKQWMVAAIGLWVLALASSVAGQLVRLPGASMMQSFAVIIALYLPVSLVVGWMAAQLAAWIDRSGPAFARLALVAVSLGAAAAGAWSQRTVVQPQIYTLVTRPDVNAMNWIREHVSPNARFLTEGFRIYEGEYAVGADAGWWLPLFTHRANTMPPQYAMVNEKPREPGYSKRLVDLVARLEKVSPASSDGERLLCDMDITHVYIGQGQGQVGAGAVQLFSPDQFVHSTAFQLAYHQDRVYIFALDPLVCGASK